MSLDSSTLSELQELMGRYPEARSALLPMLHLVQSVEGRVTSEGIETCAELLGLTSAEVSGVATFYTMYKRRPMGEHHVGVCTNTLCAVMGGDAIFDRLKDHLGIGNDETTPDGKVTLEHIECNAACDFAPVLTVNWEFFDQQTPETAVELVDALREGEIVESTRGATVTSWRDAERVIAGFEDGRVDEGPTAAGPSLAGLQIAADRGWTAPPTPDAEVTTGPGATPDTGADATLDTDEAREESAYARADAETVEEKAVPTADETNRPGVAHDPSTPTHDGPADRDPPQDSAPPQEGTDD